MRISCLLLTLVTVMPSSAIATDAAQTSSDGATLSVEAASAFLLPEQRVAQDSGYNVLVDLAHQASFFAMWHAPRGLNQLGYRAVGSQAALDSVLDPNGASRIRVPAEERRPFAWWPNARYNVVVTFQSNPESQAYLPEEIAALKEFVSAGGGLVMVGGQVRAESLAAWPLNRLAESFGLSFADIGHDEIVFGEHGAGRIVLVPSTQMIDWRENGIEPAQAKACLDRFDEIMVYARGGSKPIKGTKRLPMAAGGGGGIFPELEKRVGSVVVYYARNQKAELLRTVTEEMPKVKTQIEAWLPSKPRGEAMYLILSAGGGGGWAVNAYEPREVGIISLDPEGILSIFAHELAHTMAGPPNESGGIAGNTPDGNQGEAHAGWFQGKIKALRTGKRTNHDPNQLFDFDADGRQLDLAMDRDALRAKWGKGKDWTKIWWIWQKMDDTYGPTWYPRWRWVQHTRWSGEPDRNLTWDEVVEDMSIAVGEDLFPFFNEIGTTLARDRLQEIYFQKETLVLPVAEIPLGKAGPACLEAIGDYRQSLARDSL